MRNIPVTPESEALARRLVWFETPGEALSDPVRFVAYALARATHEDMTILRRFLTEDCQSAPNSFQVTACKSFHLVGPQARTNCLAGLC